MRTRVPYYINNMLINIFTWFLFYSLSLIAASLKFTFHFSHFHLLHCSTFQIHIHFHIFTSEVTCYFCYFCYFCYRLTILLPFYPFTFLPLNALLPLNCVPTQPFLRRDVSGTASGRSHRYVVTCLALRRDVAIATSWRSFGRIGREVKNIRMQAAIPRDALSDSSNIFLSYTGLLIFCPCVRQQYKM